MSVLKFKDANGNWVEIAAIAGKDGAKGENGKDGKDGYTPIKGVDYFDGKDGENGKDYVLTEADKQEIADMVDVSGGDVDVDLTDYYTKSEVDGLIPDTTGFTTMSAVEQKGYQTKAQVEALITAAMPASGEEVQY